jgi:hypothetical protein
MLGGSRPYGLSTWLAQKNDRDVILISKQSGSIGVSMHLHRNLPTNGISCAKPRTQQFGVWASVAQ